MLSVGASVFFGHSSSFSMCHLQVLRNKYPVHKHMNIISKPDRPIKNWAKHLKIKHALFYLNEHIMNIVSSLIRKRND
jgi:hypothetical protein